MADEERTEEMGGETDGDGRVDPKALNADQEAYRAQEWDPSGLEKREAAPAGSRPRRPACRASR